MSVRLYVIVNMDDDEEMRPGKLKDIKIITEQMELFIIHVGKTRLN